MDALYEKNLNAYKKGYPVEAREYLKKDLREEGIEVVEVTDYVGNTALKAVQKSGRSLMLNRIYGEIEALEEELQEMGRIVPNSPILVFGMSNLGLINGILEHSNGQCAMVIYEPSYVIFDYCMRHYDMEKLFLDMPTYFMVGDVAEKDLKDKIKPLLTLETIDLFRLVLSPNYVDIFPEEARKVSKNVEKTFEDLMVYWNTAKRYTSVASINLMHNLVHYRDGYNVAQLKNILKGEIPAFIVSAGPSLNKNIDELKNAKGKACIIAVDTAIKPLLNHGIKPDLFCIVDGKKPTSLMDHPGISEIPLVTSLSVAPGIMDLHSGKKFFFYSTDPFEDEIKDCVAKETSDSTYIYPQGVATGGSVANTAFGLAHMMNASHLIFVGQDLAMTNGQTHADGTFKEKMDKLSKEELASLIEVEGIDGGKVLTRGDFKYYLDWFEDYIANNKMTNVYDATEGGALIHGTKVITLKKVISKLCNRDFELSVFIDELPQMFDYSAKAEIVNIYNSFSDRMDKVAKKADEGERLYRKLSTFVGKEKNKAYTDVTKRIKKINNYMNNDGDALFVQSCLEELNYLIKTGIYNENEDQDEEIMAIAKDGVFMNHYIKEQAKEWSETARKFKKDRPMAMEKKDFANAFDEFLYKLNNGGVKKWKN